MSAGGVRGVTSAREENWREQKLLERQVGRVSAGERNWNAPSPRQKPFANSRCQCRSMAEQRVTSAPDARIPISNCS